MYKYRKAFTLIELLVVIAIIAILVESPVTCWRLEPGTDIKNYS